MNDVIKSRFWLRVTPWVALALAAVAGAALRYAFMDYLAPRGFSYFIESCVRFRYAEMRMLGLPVPALDPWVQWPEGFPVATMILSLPDRVAAAYYHLTGGGDTFLASRGLTNLLSALGVVAFAPLALAVFRRPWPAAAATLFYGGVFAAFSRSFGNYLREDFAFPALLVLSAASIYLTLGDGKGWRAWAAAVTAAGAAYWAAATWHLSQFYFAVLAFFLIAAYAFGKERGGALAAAGAWCGLALAAVTNQPLWAKGTLWGPASALLLAPALGHGLSRVFRAKNAARWFTLAAAAALAGAAFLIKRSAGYDHVYALLWAKIIHLGVKPAPASLSANARLFWVGPYDTPSFIQIWFEYGPVIAAAAAGLFWLIRDARRKTISAPTAVAVITATFVTFYALMNRLGIFLAPWAAITSAYAIARFRGPKSRAVAGAAVLLLWGFHLYGIYNYNHAGAYKKAVEDVFRPAIATPWYYGSERAQLLGTLAQVAPPGAVLADFSVSPQIMYLGSHAVALNPMFEVPEARRKAIAYAEGATASEEAFYRLCQRWRVRYVVHFAPQVLARDAGTFYNATGRDVPGGSAAWMMQFAPERMTRFRLVFETYSTRVFEVGEPYRGFHATAYHPLFDTARFPDLPKPSELEAFYREFYRADLFYRQGVAAQEQGNVVAAAAAFTSCLRLHADYEDADLRLGEVHLAMGQRDLARNAFERFAHAHPGDPRPRAALTSITAPRRSTAPGSK